MPVLSIFGYVTHCNIYSMNQPSGISSLLATWWIKMCEVHVVSDLLLKISFLSHILHWWSQYDAKNLLVIWISFHMYSLNWITSSWWLHFKWQDKLRNFLCPGASFKEPLKNYYTTIKSRTDSVYFGHLCSKDWWELTAYLSQCTYEISLSGTNSYWVCSSVSRVL